MRNGAFPGGNTDDDRMAAGRYMAERAALIPCHKHLPGPAAVQRTATTAALRANASSARDGGHRRRQ
jgi:hypothetical protein